MTFLWLLEGIRTPFLDKLMQLITYFGQEIIIIAVICTLYWCVDKRFAYFLGFTYFTAGLIVQTLKITFRIPRPWILDPDFHAVESAVPGATGYSFPSGHTQGAACLFFPMALKTKNFRLKLICISAFLSIGFSRMSRGCHTPKDVLVSLAVSLSVSLLLWRFQALLLDDEQCLKPVTLLMICISLLAAGYALYLNFNDMISAKYAADCLKASGAGLGFAVGGYLERTSLRFNPQKGSVPAQFIKLITGLLLAALIKTVFPIIFGSSVLAKALEYFILVLWVLLIYPCIFNKLLRRTL